MLKFLNRLGLLRPCPLGAGAAAEEVGEEVAEAVHRRRGHDRTY